MATVGLAVLGTTALSGVAGALGAGLRILSLVVSVALNAAMFVLAFRIATARHLTARQVAPGAIAAAVIWQLVQTFGAQHEGRDVKSASATNSVLVLVLGLIAFIYLASVAVVLCVEADVARVERLYPRALLTPLTDSVELTGGDKDFYAGQAKAQRSKGFEDISVDFDK